MITPNAATGTRLGANSGHQGLVTDVRGDAHTNWSFLWRNVLRTNPKTVILSCENMGLPLPDGRDELIAKLMDRLKGFGHIDVVAFVRNPSRAPEAFWREWVAGGRPQGARSYEEFLVDYGDRLLDLPAQFAPFEHGVGAPVKLSDFDQARAENKLWMRFCELAGLPTDLDPVDAPIYPTPDRQTSEILRLTNMLGLDGALRKHTLKGFFSRQEDRPVDPASAISPAHRMRLIDQWQKQSEAFANARGYTPEIAAWHQDLRDEAWALMSDVPVSDVQALLSAAAAAVPLASRSTKSELHTRTTPQTRLERMASAVSHPERVRIRLRPWAKNIVGKFR